MTIGIAASGTNAGESVLAAVRAAELLGRGAIGGFAVFSVMLDDGKVHHCTTQTGGVTQLTIPDEWLLATRAAAISSGPHRPEPLQQFLPGIDDIGLVTGHRLPNLAGGDGEPLNQSVLRRMADGQTPQHSVDVVLKANSESDAGLIAVDAQGCIGWGNSQRVAARADLGCVHRREGDRQLALQHNSIYFMHGTKDAVGSLAWECLGGAAGRYQLLSMGQRVSLRTAQNDAIHLDADGKIRLIETANPQASYLAGRFTAIYLGTPVWRAGCVIGHAISELIAQVEDGIVLESLEPVSAMVVIRRSANVSS
ncbi:hypothetical protein CAP48_16795 [Advenella sp. S44]|uniref:DUF6963 family protein n=1 Tax=Advenella sp. S44 TaxID=1982755 RepID=UPI000C298AF6|nr:hypothetical protein [Advenella sp. S44]PJX20977.1 hypothetical protein CAP48_16795 [Advenella sp. S44]